MAAIINQESTNSEVNNRTVFKYTFSIPWDNTTHEVSYRSSTLGKNVGSEMLVLINPKQPTNFVLGEDLPECLTFSQKRVGHTPKAYLRLIGGILIPAAILTAQLWAASRYFS
jgi:hypothetical protein